MIVDKYGVVINVAIILDVVKFAYGYGRFMVCELGCKSDSYVRNGYSIIMHVIEEEVIFIV